MQQHLTVTGWFVFIILLYVLSKTKMGYSVIYYGLLLILLLLLVGNYKAINQDLTYTS